MEESEDQCTHVDVFITDDKIIHVHRDSQDELCDFEIATNDAAEKICSVVSDKRSEKVKECFSREPKEADDKDHHDLIVVEADDATSYENNHIAQELCPERESRASTPSVRAPRYKRGPSGFVPADKPQNYMWLALCTTIFVNPPFGIIGLIIAMQSDTEYNRHNIPSARRLGKFVKFLCFLGIGITISVIISLSLVLKPPEVKLPNAQGHKP